MCVRGERRSLSGDPELARDLISSCADLRSADLSGADLQVADLTLADLETADLNCADLSYANLSHANLTYGNLERARFRETDLTGADLINANLVEADLRYARLIGTNFHSALLKGAKVSGAMLRSARFQDSDLTGTDFFEAIMSDCAFANVDLSCANGLDSVRQSGPCSIGLDTIVRSRSKLPVSFLRGCGIPEEILSFLPSLVGQVFDFYSCFISYSGKEDEFAKRMHARLQQEKLRVWFAPEDIKGGGKLYDQIDTAIRLHDKLLLVLSPASMASEWVKTEIRRRRKAEIDQGRQKLFPIRLCDMDTLRHWECFDADTGKDLAVEVREYHIPDFSNWKDHDSFEAAFAKLLRDLRKRRADSASDVRRRLVPDRRINHNRGAGPLPRVVGSAYLFRRRFKISTTPSAVRASLAAHLGWSHYRRP